MLGKGGDTVKPTAWSGNVRMAGPRYSASYSITIDYAITERADQPPGYRVAHRCPSWNEITAINRGLHSRPKSLDPLIERAEVREDRALCESVQEQGYAEWLHDGIDRNRVVRGAGAALPKDYERMMWILWPRYSDVNRDVTMQEPLAACLHPTDIPPTGYAVPTSDGFLDEATGVPFATTPDFRVARTAMERAGLDPYWNTFYVQRPESMRDLIIPVRSAMWADEGARITAVCLDLSYAPTHPSRGVGVRETRREQFINLRYRRD